MKKDGIDTQNRFSLIEIRDILISTAVLAMAFAILFRNRRFVTAWFENMMDGFWFVGMFLLMFLIVAFSIMGHEMGHKFVAQKFGMWSEYRMFPMGLLLAPFMSFVGFLFAVPGMVVVRADYITDEENGKISVAGPAVNMVLVAVGAVGSLLLNGNPMTVLFYMLMYLNGFILLFNMLPFMHLDGAKVIKWSPEVWGACITIAALGFLMPHMMPAPHYTL